MEEKKKRQPQVEDIMINTTFVMADAIDILLRNAEKRMYKNNATLSQKYKMMHNNLLRCLRDTIRCAMIPSLGRIEMISEATAIMYAG